MSYQNNIQPFDLFKCRFTDILSFHCIVRFPTRFPLLSFQIFFTSHYTKEYASLQFIDKSFSMQVFTLHQWALNRHLKKKSTSKPSKPCSCIVRLSIALNRPFICNWIQIFIPFAISRKILWWIKWLHKEIFFVVFSVYNSTPFSKLVLIKKDCNIYINYEYSLKNVGNSLTPLLMSLKHLHPNTYWDLQFFIHSKNYPKSISLSKNVFAWSYVKFVTIANQYHEMNVHKRLLVWCFNEHLNYCKQINETLSSLINGNNFLPIPSKDR